MMTPDAETLAKAHLLIACVEGEIRLGTRHYNKSRRLLTTVREIVQTVLDEGMVTIEPASHRLQHFQEITRKYAHVCM